MSQSPRPSRKALDKMSGMLLVTLEDLQPGREQILEFTVAGVRDQGVLKCSIDLLMIGDLVLGIGLIEGGAFQSHQLLFLRLGLLHERAAGVVVLWLDVQL